MQELVGRQGALLTARQSLARALSIAGHPGVLMPAAVALGAAADGTPPARAMAAVAAALLVALTVGAWAWWQVRTGRWVHADASLPRERRQLNLFAAALLFGGRCPAGAGVRFAAGRAGRIAGRRGGGGGTCAAPLAQGVTARGFCRLCRGFGVASPARHTAADVPDGGRGLVAAGAAAAHAGRGTGGPAAGHCGGSGAALGGAIRRSGLWESVIKPSAWPPVPSPAPRPHPSARLEHAALIWPGAASHPTAACRSAVRRSSRGCRCAEWR